jgi:uncharacterized protein (TIGR02679 family)
VNAGVPQSLLGPGLDELWALVRMRLERRGDERLGRLRLPTLNARARLALTSLLGRSPGATVDLAALEVALRGLGLGSSLSAALAALGHPVSPEPGRRRNERRAALDAREAARAAVAAWRERWATAWIDDVIRGGGLRGLDAPGAIDLVVSVRAVIDRLDQGAAVGTPISRVDLAAALFGSSHALDTGTRLEAAVTRALTHHVGPMPPRSLWEQAGVHLDLTSAPALTWALPIDTCHGLGALASAATQAGVPLHLTQLALRRHPITVAAASDVLVVENPRLVEAAVQDVLVQPMVATNGNPSAAVQLLLAQLLACGAHVRYHGDFDAAGLAICARLHALGLVPWRMDAPDYISALDAARDAGVDLPIDATPAPTTPWDPSLQRVFDEHRRVVHEERLLPGLLRG